jgi:hypothetical protein
MLLGRFLLFQESLAADMEFFKQAIPNSTKVQIGYGDACYCAFRLNVLLRWNPKRRRMSKLNPGPRIKIAM